MSLMTDRPHEFPDPALLVIDDDFSRLPDEEQARLTDEWIASLRQDDEPLVLSVSPAQLVAEAREESGW
jgi:hypothetical protein